MHVPDWTKMVDCHPPCIVVYFGNTVARVAAVVQIAMAWPPFTSSDAPETKLASWEVR